MNINRITGVLGVFVLLYMGAVALPAEAVDAKSILEYVDSYRQFSKNGFSFDFSTRPRHTAFESRPSRKPPTTPRPG